MLQRNKSSKDSQSLLKEVLAQFDIETHVNKIAVRCFNDLLKSNRQAFDFITESEKKLVEFETRLCKTEGFAASIEKNVENKIEIANTLNRRIETFSNEFYQGLRENEALFQGLRKDYDSVLAANHKNTYDLRAVSDAQKKNGQQIDAAQSKISTEIASFASRIDVWQLQLQKQVAEVRLECESFRCGLTQAKTQYQSQSQRFEQATKDVNMYKYEKDGINQRFNQLFKEISAKLPKSQFYQTRLLLDSRITTLQQSNLKSFTDVRSLLKDEKEQRKEVEKAMRSEQSTCWLEQAGTNSFIQTKISDINRDLLVRTDKLSSKLESLESSLMGQIQNTRKQLQSQQQWARKELKEHGSIIDKHTSLIADCDKFMMERHSEIMELESNMTSIGERIDAIIRENQQRKKEFSKIQSSQNKDELGKSVNSLNQHLQQFQSQLFDNSRALTELKAEIAKLQLIRDEDRAINQEGHKILEEKIKSQHFDLVGQVQQLYKSLGEHSAKIKQNLQGVRQESKKYADGLIDSVRSQLQFLDKVSEQMKLLKQAFDDQMKETKAVNQSITDKMEKSNASMTKFKSDLSLRVEAILNEQTRRGIEQKDIVRQVEEFKKLSSLLTEGLTVSLSVCLHREMLEDNELPREVKVSSLLEGWVLQIEDKNARYRGEPLNRRRLILAFLTFLLSHSEKYKGGLIQSGKEVYLHMLADNQQIFTRKKGMSRRMGSQLPKLHL